MRQLRRTLLGLVLVSLVGCGTSENTPIAQSIVRQIDHILIESSEARQLFALFSDTLQLPVAWPMSDYGEFASGGVAVGNVNLEVLQASEPIAGGARSRLTGFALEPEPLQQSLAALKARRIQHGKAAPFRSIGPNGTAVTLWTTVGLPTLSHDAVPVFLCEYAHDVAETRRQSVAQLRSRSGGPLGVLSVKELVYGTTDAPRMQTEWQAVLRPIESTSPGVWPIGDGPAIRVIQAEENGITGIVISVVSLAQARQFLEERELLRTGLSGEVMLRSNGLAVSFVEGSGV